MTTAADVYTDLVESLLAAEASRKASLEQRGGAVITSSGVLVTLLFGLVAVVTGSKTFQLPSAAHGWLYGATGCFVAAAVFAILMSVPIPYGETRLTSEELARWWFDPPAKAQAAVAGLRLRALMAARRMNTVKAWLLIVATAAEIAAVGLLAWAVVEILRHG